MNSPARPEDKRLPPDQWNFLMRHSIAPSMNLVIENKRREFLFILRKFEPAKGLLWLPGGRQIPGEYKEDTVWRILEKEIGLTREQATLIGVSNEMQDEKFNTSTMNPKDVEERYGPNLKSIEYVGGAAYLKLRNREAPISLDEQSEDHQWLRELPNHHPFLVGYFRMIERLGFKTLELPPQSK